MKRFQQSRALSPKKLFDEKMKNGNKRLAFLKASRRTPKAAFDAAHRKKYVPRLSLAQMIAKRERPLGPTLFEQSRARKAGLGRGYGKKTNQR